ncbi:MAG: exodeoxyribonuclease V subunit gamma [Oscillospiraceae bacterium]|nr:exodeoxyribonuclease V subunit gamma [Oscillospiraceae bacterium]
MLRIVTGEYPDEKMVMYGREIKTLLEDSKDVLCVIPDQFSFQFDKMLYSELGAKDFNRVEVKSFRRLSDEILTSALAGGAQPSGTIMRPEEKIPIIYLTLKEVRRKKALKALTRFLDKPAFIDEIGSVIESLIRSETTVEQLYSGAERIEGTAGDKLFDIALIYEEYLRKLSERGLRDESSIISAGAVIADTHEAFRGKYIYVDRFNNFSQDELSMLRCMIRDAIEVSVSVTLPEGEKHTPTSVYSQSFETKDSLTSLCRSLDKSCRLASCTSKPVKQNGITELSDCVNGNFAAGKNSSFSEPDGSVRIYSCRSIYDEADFVAASIRELVSSGKYTYNDISVIASDISNYEDAIEASFEKYDIPYFLDQKHKASDMSVMLFAFALIDAASTRKPDTDRIMKYVRSPFSEFDELETSLIEDYTVRWNVDGEMWLSDFTVGEEKELSTLNSLRSRIIEPLRKLHDACRSADARTVAAAFSDCLEESRLTKRARDIIESYYDEDEKLEAARQFKQLWNALMNSVAAIYNTIGDDKLTLKEFGELLKLSLSDSGISNPPQKLSCVVISDLARSVITSPKVAFTMGANDGIFPNDSKKTGIFSGRDAELLEREGLKFEISDEHRLSGSRFDCYTALTCPSDLEIISYAVSDTTGRHLRPSITVTRAIKRLDIQPVKADSLPLSFYCSAPEAAFYRYCIGESTDETELVAVRKSLETLPEFRERLHRLEASKNPHGHRLSPAVAKETFAKHDINVTASRIDTYNHCPFSYFIRYGLGIEPVEPMTINPANRGSVMHFVFENVLERFGDGFDKATDSEIESAVSEFLEIYEKENLGGDFGKNFKFKADYERLASACCEILFNIREEYEVSRFRPVRFEYDLSRENGESVLSIPINQNLKINIRGIVDRIDAYEAEDSKKYIRVVDYKTGSKAFRFEDIYNGLNLQLLLYMVALTEGTDESFRDCTPAGIFYMKAGFLECDDDYSPLSDSAEDRLRRRAEQLKRSGLILENDDAVTAMDENISGKYVPVKKKRDGSYTKQSCLISEESFRLLRNFAKSKTVQFGNDLLNGKIDAVPVGPDSIHVRCSNCGYQSVCARAGYIYKPVTEEDGDKLKAEIKYGGEPDAELDT